MILAMPCCCVVCKSGVRILIPLVEVTEHKLVREIVESGIGFQLFSNTDEFSKYTPYLRSLCVEKLSQRSHYSSAPQREMK
jgi:hypothetical protein